jgi:hypothetical protein
MVPEFGLSTICCGGGDDSPTVRLKLRSEEYPRV